jgi:hypothetical protein
MIFETVTGSMTITALTYWFAPASMNFGPKNDSPSHEIKRYKPDNEARLFIRSEYDAVSNPKFFRTSLPSFTNAKPPILG